jgi:quercetin dioxygenase-like cupin family protein
MVTSDWISPGWLTRSLRGDGCASNLKNIMKKIVLLFSVLVTAAAFTIAAEKKESSKDKKASDATVTAEHKVVAPAEMQWVDAPPGVPPGAKMVVLDGDPGKRGQFTVRFQFPADYKILPHTHPTDEHITVISGKLNLGMGDKFDQSTSREMPANSFGVMPAGMVHFAWAGEPTVIQIHGTGPFKIRYVNPADDPRNAKK